MHKSIEKILIKIRYPKFFLLLLTYLFAYLIFAGNDFTKLRLWLISLGYIGTFLSGIMFAYGFTSGPATAIFLILAKHQNIILAGLIGGIGALLGDLIIFKFIRFTFADEINRMAVGKTVKFLDRILPKIIKKYFIPLLAVIIIASPLPDEIGVALLAMARKISIGVFSVISFVLNTAGIYVILIIGNSI